MLKQYKALEGIYDLTGAFTPLIGNIRMHNLYAQWKKKRKRYAKSDKKRWQHCRLQWCKD